MILIINLIIKIKNRIKKIIKIIIIKRYIQVINKILKLKID